MSLIELRKDLQKSANREKAEHEQRYFKTGKGEYGEGDIFKGLTVPQCRVIAKKYKDLDLKDLQILLNSKIHEERLIALLILVDKYKTTNHQKIIFHFYLKNTKNINNWDLVDLSAAGIAGRHLFNNELIRVNLHGKNFLAKPFEILEILARSKNIWERRIALLASFYFIKNNKFSESLKLSEMLLSDREDLIQKALGWMLREIGKRNLKVEEEFLKVHYKNMGRTALRYAIEKFSEDKRKKYLGRR